MRWMETIRVRLTDTDRASIIHDLSRQLSNLAPRDGLEETRLYSDPQIQTDFSISFHRHDHRSRAAWSYGAMTTAAVMFDTSIGHHLGALPP